MLKQELAILREHIEVTLQELGCKQQILRNTSGHWHGKRHVIFKAPIHWEVSDDLVIPVGHGGEVNFRDADGQQALSTAKARRFSMKSWPMPWPSWTEVEHDASPWKNRSLLRQSRCTVQLGGSPFGDPCWPRMPHWPGFVSSHLETRRQEAKHKKQKRRQELTKTRKEVLQLEVPNKFTDLLRTRLSVDEYRIYMVWLGLTVKLAPTPIQYQLRV